ncbi:hypothetical protein PRUPE_4G124400 [Prunus persica]|uniref:Uncharacterized protein n=1 Tax=Prunus persica TaxID=3760 RepID=A0A251PL33_PRUPE|nr:hypothetical protein PRUPE_4G124400 [Prunus persica]
MLIVLYGKKFMPVKHLLPHAWPEFNSHFPLPLDQRRKKKNTNPIILKSLTVKSHHFEIPSLQNSIISKSLIQTQP